MNDNKFKKLVVLSEVPLESVMEMEKMWKFIKAKIIYVSCRGSWFADYEVSGNAVLK